MEFSQLHFFTAPFINTLFRGTQSLRREWFSACGGADLHFGTQIGRHGRERRVAYTVQKDTCGRDSHFAAWRCDGCQLGIQRIQDRRIVKTGDQNIIGHFFVQGAQRGYGLPRQQVICAAEHVRKGGQPAERDF